MSRWFFAITALALMSLSASAQAEKKKVERLTPTAADVAYGEHERQKFDFWQAKSDKPTPLVVMIHGGGWVNGDKSGYGTAAQRVHSRYQRTLADLPWQGLAVTKLFARSLSSSSVGCFPSNCGAAATA